MKRVTFKNNLERHGSTVLGKYTGGFFWHFLHFNFILVYHDLNLKAQDGETFYANSKNTKILFKFYFHSVSLLTGPFWLNDQIIAFYYLYLEYNKFANYSDEFLFVSPQVTQLLKLSDENDYKLFLDPLKPDEKKVLFFAVNNNDYVSSGGSHWSLLVYSRNEDSFFSFDSMHDLNMNTTMRMIAVLKKALRGARRSEFHALECAQQTNGYDCGIHVLINTENVCNHWLNAGIVRHVPIARQSKISTKRSEILDIINYFGGNVEDLTSS